MRWVVVAVVASVAFGLVLLVFYCRGWYATAALCCCECLLQQRRLLGESANAFEAGADREFSGLTKKYQQSHCSVKHLKDPTNCVQEGNLNQMSTLSNRKYLFPKFLQFIKIEQESTG